MMGIDGDSMKGVPAAALLAAEAARLRLSALDQVMQAGFGHLGSCMSCAELVAGSFQVLDLPRDGRRGTDCFVLSKGHAVPMLYAAMAPASELIPYAIAGSAYPGHPNAMLTPGVHVSSGSVGMGLAIGLGIAAGFELQGRTARVAVLAGDGEMQAGMIWESVQNMAHRPALPLLFMIDANGYQGGMAAATNGVTRRMLEAAAPEFHAVAGNDAAAVLAVMQDFAVRPRAMVVWAETRRGARVALLEEHPLPMTWRPEPADAERIRADLRAQAQCARSALVRAPSRADVAARS